MNLRTQRGPIAAAMLLLLLTAGVVRAELRLPAVISDHMVLQRGHANRLWGWDTPGQRVTMRLGDGDAVAVTAGDDGKWMATLPAMTAAGPHSLTIVGSSTMRVADVLLGEVWLASGQSNMAMTVSRSLNPEAEAKAADLPQIRMFTTARAAAVEPASDCNGSWVVCSPATVGGFSATAYFFGRELHAELDCPVGLINSSWGGTAVEAWTSRAAQERRKSLAPVLAPWDAQVAAYDAGAAKQKYERALARWQKAAAAAKQAGKRAPRRPRLADPAVNQNRPANLFNGMIHPLIPYGIRGAIWYQGERNRRGPAELYGQQLDCLIQDWRQRWGIGEFPFGYVQLPNFMAPQTDPVEPDGWVTVRAGMDATLQTPNTGMAVTIDVGEANDIHPKNKQAVGKRLALWALAKAYDRDLLYSGPRLRSADFNGPRVILAFDHVGEGLRPRDGEALTGFAVAGEDRKFHWAEARIRGDSVEVACDAAPKPVSVRYAWAPNPKANLVNSAGLPAAPFRTDNWPLAAAK